jgi:hypothetical protein
MRVRHYLDIEGRETEKTIDECPMRIRYLSAKLTPGSAKQPDTFHLNNEVLFDEKKNVPFSHSHEQATKVPTRGAILREWPGITTND